MAHSLSSASAAASASSSSTRFNSTRFSCLKFPTLQLQARCNAYNEAPDNYQIPRRSMALVLTGATLGLNVANGKAEAAARRPPPPPPQEKKDPNVTGVQAKVLASKKRKEAMKEAIGKLRAKGKTIEQPPPE